MVPYFSKRKALTRSGLGGLGLADLRDRGTVLFKFRQGPYTFAINWVKQWERTLWMQIYAVAAWILHRLMIQERKPEPMCPIYEQYLASLGHAKSIFG